MKSSVYIALTCLLLHSCGGHKSSNSEGSSTADATNSEPKQHNISILLDLSNRVDTTSNCANPQHYVRDLEIVKSITSYFISDMKSRGTFNSKGKIKVVFSPLPNDPNVNVIAQKLNVDCSEMNNTQKKEVYDNLTGTFNDNLSKIYKQTLIDKNWIGSDIWRFFKDDIDMCIENDNNYRNTLVIITDGYIYHENTMQNVGNRYSYLSPTLFEKYKLRNNNNWETEIKNSDFGLLVSRNGLSNLEVLVLEVSTCSTNHKTDQDVMKYVLNNWLIEMGITKSAIYFSDLPVYTQKRIGDFLSISL